MVEPDPASEQNSTDELEPLLTSVAYPATRDTLIARGREAKLDDDVQARLANLPDTAFSDAAEVRQVWVNGTPDSTRVDDLQR